jgi:hypothetical protein
MQVGTDWSGKYSRWSYDESKSYVLLAKEKLGPTNQSVPLLDDELNCQAEAQLMLLRRAIKRVFGDGTDNDGFDIVQSPTNTTNNFAIKGGDGTIAGAGHMFVDGWMPFLLSDIEYNAQSWAVALTTPTADRTDQVYLDCWLEEIAGTDDSNIIDSTVGFETSRRLKLSWKVTVDEGATPHAYDTYTDATNYLHHIALIATIDRLASGATITEAMILDKRNADRALKRGEMFFFQSTAASVWNVAHNLNSDHLIVNLWDDGYNLIDAPIEILDMNNFRVNFGNSTVRGGAMIKALKMDNIEIGL